MISSMLGSPCYYLPSEPVNHYLGLFIFSLLLPFLMTIKQETIDGWIPDATPDALEVLFHSVSLFHSSSVDILSSHLQGKRAHG